MGGDRSRNFGDDRKALPSGAFWVKLVKNCKNHRGKEGGQTSGTRGKKSEAK